MKLFLDTNIFLRYMVVEDKKSFAQCQRIFHLIEAGKIHPYTSSVVIQEIVYVLSRSYKFSREQILKKMPLVFKLRQLTFTEKADTFKSVELYSQYNIKFADCLIATQIPNGVPMCTYDPDFSKIKGLKVVTPAQVLV